MTVADYWKHRSEVRVIKQADIVLAMYLLEDDFTAMKSGGGMNSMNR